MSDMWVPVMLAAVIVFGVVGGSVVMFLLKELTPILRTIAEQRRAPAGDDVRSLTAELKAVQARLATLESEHRRVAEQTDFAHRLLQDRHSSPE
jgi:hypothetical protein